jgi:hypothetical protein
MGSRRAAAVFTDPPFNVKIDGHATGNGAIKHREFVMASGEMSEAEFVSFLNNSLRLMGGYSANNSVHYICMDWRHAGDLIAAGKQNYDEFLNMCVWVASWSQSGHRASLALPHPTDRYLWQPATRVAAVCANCHRRAHFSRDAGAFNQTLELAVRRLERED